MTATERPEDEPDRGLSGLSDEELVEIASSVEDVPAAFAYARMQWFAESRTTPFGWFLDDGGEVAVDAGWVAVPSALIEVLGPEEAADDLVEVVPVGAPGTLTAVRVTWQVYRPELLTALLRVRGRDGTEWRLEPVAGGYGVDLPADLAVQVENEELATYEIELAVTVAPLDGEIDAVEDIERLVGEWAGTLRSDLAGGPDLTSRIGRSAAEAGAEPALSRGVEGLELPADVAQQLGIYRHVSWSIDGTELVVVVVPDPDAEADLSDRIVVAAVDAQGGVMAAGRLELGDTVHTCRLSIGDVSYLAKVVLSELADG